MVKVDYFYDLSQISIPRLLFHKLIVSYDYFTGQKQAKLLSNLSDSIYILDTTEALCQRVVVLLGRGENNFSASARQKKNPFHRISRLEKTRLSSLN